MPLTRVKTVFVIGCVLSLLTACNTTTAVKPTPLPPTLPGPPGLVGGYSVTPIQDPEVQQAAKFATAQLAAKGMQLQSILSAHSQVVAGRNLRLVLQMSNGERYEVVVYINLDNQMQLTSSRQL